MNNLNIPNFPKNNKNSLDKDLKLIPWKMAFLLALSLIFLFAISFIVNYYG